MNEIIPHVVLGTSAVRTLTVTEPFSVEMVETARTLFKEMNRKGVIINDSFEDNRWMTTDEVSRVTLNFGFNELSYKKWYEGCFGIPLSQFVEYTKAFYMHLFGSNVLKMLQTSLNDIRRIIRTDPEEVYGVNAKLNIVVPGVCIDFFSSFSEDNERVSELAEALEQYFYIYAGKNGKQRTLSRFNSYLNFDEAIKRFWKECDDTEMRLFYFPLYIWWEVTAIMPTRPKEFLLTERDCLTTDATGTYLKLRKNRLKGSGRSVHYKLDKDYYTINVKIPERISKALQWYLDETRDYDDTSINTLLITDTHYWKWRQKKHENSRFLTYVNLNTILRYFYAEVLEGMYGYHIAGYGEVTDYDAKNIERIHLGDSRHFSMISLMQQGGTPLLAMVMSGHEDEEMSMHYATNMSTLVECQTMRMYREIKKGNTEFLLSTMPQLEIKDRKKVKLTDGTYCDSVVFQNANMEDCYKAYGPDGEMGYCPGCRHHLTDGKSHFGSKSVYEREITERAKELITAVNNVRNERGCMETVGELVLRLKDATNGYQQFLIEKKMKEEANGKTETDQ